jgi:hypothetical protein
MSIIRYQTLVAPTVKDPAGKWRIREWVHHQWLSLGNDSNAGKEILRKSAEVNKVISSQPSLATLAHLSGLPFVVMRACYKQTLE